MGERLDFPLWSSYFVRGGSAIRLRKSGFGMWAYIATAGGFEVPPVLGSRATYLRGRFGGLDGRQLQSGDSLRGASPPQLLMERAGRSVRRDRLPAYGPSPIVDVLRGPQSGRFGEEELARFTSGAYRVSVSSDRMGYRLEGAALHGGGSDMTSQGMSVGCIQAPAGGQLIAMMADCATTGGYPVIACVTSAAMPLLAQCSPGVDEVRFRETSVEEAQGRYRSIMEGLKQGIIEEENGIETTDKRWKAQ